MKKILCLLLAALLILGCFSACGKSSASDQNTFTWWLHAGEDASFYEKYEENPSVQYLLNKQWAGTKLNLEFSAAPAGSEQDNFNQMLATGEYLDVINMASISQTPLELYNEGVILDLTELVQQYMPNYWNFVQTNPDLARSAWVDVGDGEMKILSIYNFNDAPQNNFQGYMYRRDWIAKYGTDPSTGEAFEYGFADPEDKESWFDNIVFPSYYQYNGESWYDEVAVNQGADPVTISDWEWMFQIFDKAMAELGITDSYNISMYYPGYLQLGDIYSGFGGGCPWWCYNSETGTVEFGATNDSMKAYLECMQNWYGKGWLDPEFNTRSDMFYMIDSASVYQGKVGMWCGLTSQVGTNMDTGDFYTEGMVVYGCTQPINDIYGGDAQKFQRPNGFYAFPIVMNCDCITTAAEGKNLEALLTMLDYLYTEEGARIKSFGLTLEQAQTLESGLCLEYLPEGAYTMEEKNGEYFYTYSAVAATRDDIANAMKPNRIQVGLTKNINLDYGYDRYLAYTQNLWGLYQADAVIPDSIVGSLTPEEQKTRGKVENNMDTYMNTTVPQFINGTLDLQGTDWEDFCTTVGKYGVKTMIDIYQAKYDKLN